ncbi:winged helix-turn-helix domain-containing protein [Halovenus sp. HT40]|uniref:winged helix-turn-helix domain-containing protein n=1 Tax=Halovenus sp. HT40 TaxID=3126691 RepID=UPI00300EAF3E
MGKKAQISSVLRNTNKPALSAQDLANELDVSVNTINNHVSEMVENGRIETAQIGNAAAYYIPFDDLPPHKKPEHTCHKCGHTTDGYDFAKVEYDTYFEDGSTEESIADFYILCRPCYSDFVSWAYGDIGSMQEYPRVHSYDISEKQLFELRDDPDVPTTPDLASLDDDRREVYDLIAELGGDEGITLREIQSRADEHQEIFVPKKSTLRKLSEQGYLYKTLGGVSMKYIAAK